MNIIMAYNFIWIEQNVKKWQPHKCRRFGAKDTKYRKVHVYIHVLHVYIHVVHVYIHVVHVY